MKALVVLSGGQDSVTCLFKAIQDHEEVHAVTFDYGQRHKIEIEAALKTASLAGVKSHEIIKLPEGVLQGKSFLTDLTAEVETFESFDHMSHHNAFKENKLDSSFVPMRNPLFLTIAANRAAVLECDTIITGVTAADFAEYGDFSWEWLGGFVDAEGCFSKTNTSSFHLAISQKDPELLHRLGAWIKQQLPEFTYGFNIDKTGCANLYISKLRWPLVEGLLTPHLHSPWRRSQAEKYGVACSDEAPLTDSYVTGFWEGDGGCHGRWTTTSSFNSEGQKKVYPVREFQLGFYQKDPTVLQKIKEYLGRGWLGPHDDTVHALTICDGPLSAKIVNRMRKYFCVLGSFAKITRNRHKIGLKGGGFNPPYPDCTPDFILEQNKVIEESLRTPWVEPVKIETPLMYLTKAMSVLLAKSLPGCWEALAYSHTSYAGVYPPTTNDHATLLRAAGFEHAKLPDPLVVRAWHEGAMDLPTTPNYDKLRQIDSRQISLDQLLLISRA